MRAHDLTVLAFPARTAVLPRSASSGDGAARRRSAEAARRIARIGARALSRISSYSSSASDCMTIAPPVPLHVVEASLVTGSRAGPDARRGGVAHDGAEDDAKVGGPAEAEVAERARVPPARVPLE